MPGTYEKGKFDIAGFAVGIVSEKKVLSKKKSEKMILFWLFLQVGYIQMDSH